MVDKAFVDEKDVPLECKVLLEQGLLREVDIGEETLLVPITIESRIFYRDPNYQDGYALLAVCSYVIDGSKVTSDVEIAFGRNLEN